MLLNKVMNKVFRHGKSRTGFLRNNEVGQIENSEKFGIEYLTGANRKDFEKIKFWDIVRIDEFISNPNQSALLLKAGEEYIFYVAEECEICREISGLVLKSNTAHELVVAISCLDNDRAMLLDMKHNSKLFSEKHLIENKISNIVKDIRVGIKKHTSFLSSCFLY